MKQPICVDTANAGCGEGALWDAQNGCLWWVDIAGCTLHRFDPNTGRCVKQAMPWLISALALRVDNRLLIATIKGVGLVDEAGGAIDILHDPEPEISGNRLNDMAVDPAGQLWVGSMSEGGKNASGSLYRYGPDSCTRMLSNRTLSNGIDWSPDGQRLYFIDSVPGILFVQENDQWQVLREFNAATGTPDGLAVDADGTLWVALCHGGIILGLSPQGETVNELQLPCDIVTNCTFGGADLRTLFVTTGTFGMSDAEKKANPLAGGLFTIDMDVPGKLPYKARWP